MKSLQGLILYHLRGATCSTAIIGMDGTATIRRKTRGTGREKKKKRGRDDGDEQRGKAREQKTDREETSWREDKEARHQGVKLMQMMTLSVLQRHNEGGK